MISNTYGQFLQKTAKLWPEGQELLQGQFTPASSELWPEGKALLQNSSDYSILWNAGMMSDNKHLWSRSGNHTICGLPKPKLFLFQELNINDEGQKAISSEPQPPAFIYALPVIWLLIIVIVLMRNE